MTQYIHTHGCGSGLTQITLDFIDETFTLSINSQWMGSEKVNIVLNGFIKNNSNKMKTLYTNTLTDKENDETIDLTHSYNETDHDSLLVFRFIELDNNILFDIHDNVSGVVYAGGGYFNLCCNNCSNKCNKCFTYDSILIGCISESFNEYQKHPLYKKYKRLLKYNLMRKN